MVIFGSSYQLANNGPVVWGVAVCVRVGMCFCKVLIDGRAFGVRMKLSRWRGPDKWAGFVMSRKSCLGGVAGVTALTMGLNKEREKKEKEDKSGKIK